MSKFVIACPRCHRYVEAKTGFFASKRIKCTCGNNFNIKTERLTSRICPSCGNNVAYDVAEGTQATCPVCHAQLVTELSMSQFLNFHCSTCGCELQARKTDQTVTCPICDTVNDVQKMFSLEKTGETGKPVVIMYEGDNKTVVWKHPFINFVTGSELIVHESQEAIFFRDGEALDSFRSGKYILNTDLLPKLSKRGGEQNPESFHAEVYFVNMTTQMGIKWGTSSRVNVIDPETKIPLELGASGTFNMRVTNPRKLVIDLVGTTDKLNQEQLYSGSEGYFRSLVLNKVKSNMARIIMANNISVLELDAHIDQISVGLRDAINEELERYGLTMPEFYISNIVLDEAITKKLKELRTELYLRTTQKKIDHAVAQQDDERDVIIAKKQAEIAAIKAQQEAEAKRIQAAAEADAYRMKAEAEAQEMHMKGYTYQDETQRQVATEAVKGGNASAVGTVIETSMKLGAVQNAANMTRSVVSGIMGNGAAYEAWNCVCGQTGLTSDFCPSCGRPRTAANSGWTCRCGCTNLTSKFCPSCGAPRPTAAAGWTCSCGRVGNSGDFCPDCGQRRP